MPVYGRTAHDIFDDSILGGADSTHAVVNMLRAFTISDAPIKISKMTIYGRTQFGSTNGYLKGIICDATDNGNGTFSVTNVLGTTTGITVPGSTLLQEWDMFFASPLSINSNKTCAMGLFTYSDLGSDYGWFFSNLDNAGGGYNQAISSSIYDYGNPPTDLTGLGSNQVHVWDWDMYVTYSIKVPLGLFDPELVPVAIF